MCYGYDVAKEITRSVIYYMSHTNVAMMPVAMTTIANTSRISTPKNFHHLFMAYYISCHGDQLLHGDNNQYITYTVH